MSNKIKEIRKAKKIKQKDIAQAAGVSRQTISKLENGMYCNSVILAYKVAKFLGEEIESVFDLTEAELK